MIAITGAAGFIGSNLAHQLHGTGRKLLLVDGAENLGNLVGLDSHTFLKPAEFLAACDSGTVQPEAIYHLGACSNTTEQNWDYLQRNNIEYSQTLWNHSVRSGAAFVYASSAATYGDGSRGFDDTTPPEQLLPLNLYGKSKNDFDAWAIAQARKPKRWAGLKFFNVYGPREASKGQMASVVWQAFRQVMSVGRVRLFRSNDPKYADGCQLRDFVLVGDCIAHLRWCATQQQPGGVYNSGTAQARTFLDLVHAVFATLDRVPIIEWIDMPASLSKQYQNYTRAEMHKLRTAGYAQLPTSLEAGVRQTVLWYQQHVRPTTL